MMKMTAAMVVLGLACASCATGGQSTYGTATGGTVAIGDTAIKEIGGVAVDTLRAYLSDQSPIKRTQAAQELGTRKDVASTAKLTEMSRNDADPGVRAAALAAVTSMK
jgi:hypothetical protein